MKIGILPYETGAVLSGIGRSTAAKCEEIERIDTGNEYYLLSDDLNICNSWKKIKTLRNSVGITDLNFVTAAYGFDIIHSNTAAFHVSDRIRCKKVLTINDIRPLSHPEWDTGSMEAYFDGPLRKCAEECDAIVAISEYTKRDIIEYYGVPDDKVRVIYLGLYPEDRFNGDGIRPGNEKIISGKYILFVSGIDKNKNQSGLIEAYGIFRERNRGNDIKLVLTGPERMSSELTNSLNRYPDLKENIIYTGYVSDDELVWLYKNALSFIYPSFFEGFGLPVLEAMSVGKAVISSNTTSLPEVGGDAVEYCDPYDAESIADSVERVVYNEGYRNELEKKAIERAKIFSYRQAGEKTVGLYRELFLKE